MEAESEIISSSKKVERCIKNSDCKKISSESEKIALIILAFDRTNKEKYIKNIITASIKYDLNDKKSILIYLTSKIKKEKINLSKDSMDAVIELMNEVYQNLPSSLIYEFLDQIDDEIIISKLNVEKLATRVWIYHKFKNNYDEAEFFIKYQRFFTMDTFLKRIDRMLLAGDVSDADRIIELIKEGTNSRKISEQKLKIISVCKKNKSSEIIEALKKINTSEVSVNMMLLKCMTEANDKDVLKFALKIGESEGWLTDAVWRYQNLAVIEMMNQKKYSLAKEILLASTPNKKEDFVQHQWILGWINLRFLDDPKSAIKHFSRMLENSGYAISVARGNYWLGRSYEEIEKDGDARKYYLAASQYPTTFYGQKAIKKLKLDIKLQIDKYSAVNIVNENDFKKNIWLEVGLILYKNQMQSLGEIIIQSSFHKQNKKDIANMLFLTGKILDQYTIGPISRYATRFGIYIPKISYPRKIQDIDNFSMSIIRQESVFNPAAVSNVGALGIMQVMPETAKIICRKLGIKYSARRMLEDRNYNIKIGREYIRSMLEKFNGSKIMTAAAYNAGPGAVNKWIGKFGNPNNIDSEEEVIDWIESITYSQTRDYVMRIMENYEMYENIWG